jgi:hypothetical protein
MIEGLVGEISKQYYNSFFKRAVDEELDEIKLENIMLNINADPQKILLSSYFYNNYEC